MTPPPLPAASSALPLRVLLVEDDPIARLSLRSLLEQQPSVFIAGEAASCSDARAALAGLSPDAVFLDITLPDGNAFDLIGSIDRPLGIVMVTVSDAHAVRAFEANALDYLLKPVSAPRLAESLRRLREQRGGTPAGPSAPRASLQLEDPAFLPLPSGQIIVRVSEIALIQGHGNTTEVRLADGRKFRTRRSLNHWQRLLPTGHFPRVSRTRIVNLATVRELVRTRQGASLRLTDDSPPIPVTRRRARLLARVLSAPPDPPLCSVPTPSHG